MENPRHSFIASGFIRLIEWGNEWLTLSRWLFKGDTNIFIKIESLNLIMTLVCVILLFTVQWIPFGLLVLVAILLVQRVIEFLVVYSRNFILKKGRIYSQFNNETLRGIWLIIMFSLNMIQVILAFAIAYRILSLSDSNMFSQALTTLDCLYFSVTTFLTIGFGDIRPVSDAAKTLVILQGALFYFVLVVVINGLTSTHFGSRKLDQPDSAE